MAVLTFPWMIIWPVLVLIAASLITCKCCCRDDGGKSMATTAVVLTSISFIGSFVDIAILSHAADLCRTYDVTEHPICKFIAAALAWCVIALFFRLCFVVLAGRLCCGCCGAQKPVTALQQVVTLPAVALQPVSVAAPPVSVAAPPVTATSTKV